MDTKKGFGPAGWKFLFCIAANYPVTIDSRNKHHLALQKHYCSFFEMLKFMLPCVYCRRSYAKFIKKIPIQSYLGSRRDIMFWLYLIKDQVNKKLIRQEMKKSNSSFTTKPSPPFEKVCTYYEQFRAKCSTKSQTCERPQLK